MVLCSSRGDVIVYGPQQRKDRMAGTKRARGVIPRFTALEWLGLKVLLSVLEATGWLDSTSHIIPREARTAVRRVLRKLETCTFDVDS